jgi:hypothetical protein
MEPPPLQQRDLVHVEVDLQGCPHRIYERTQRFAVHHVAAQWSVVLGPSGGPEEHFLVELEDEALIYLVCSGAGNQRRWYRQRINPRAWRRRLAQGALGKASRPLPEWKKPLP